jgi:zinc transporter
MARTGHLGARPLALVETLVRTDTAQRESSIERLTDTLNRIEDRVLSEIGEFDRSQIIRIRHSLVRQHRELDGLRRLFDRVDLEIREESGRSDATRAGAGSERGAESTEFGSLLQHLNALVDRCLALLDRARLLQQEVSDQLTVQTNRQLYVLSILTAALVPPTIVVGLFGMNTGGLPLTDTPLGFVAAVALCALSSLLVLGVLAAFGLIRRPRLQWWRRSALHPADAAAFASEDRDISVRGTKSPTASRHRE